jgi:hypothetical protein
VSLISERPTGCENHEHPGAGRGGDMSTSPAPAAARRSASSARAGPGGRLRRWARRCWPACPGSALAALCDEGRIETASVAGLAGCVDAVEKIPPRNE